MVGEGIQSYVDMAAGLSKATKAKARAAAKNLLATAGLEEVAADATDRVTKLTEEVIAASRANRELMNKLVATEVDKAAGRLGFVRSDEIEDLRRELAELRMSMAHSAAHESDLAEPPAPAPFAADLGIPDPPAPVDALTEPDDAPPIETIVEPVVPPAKRAAKKASAKKAPAAKSPAVTSPTAPAKKSAAKKAPAKKTQVRAPSAKVAASAPAKKTPAAKATPAAKKAAKKTPATSAGTGVG